MRPGDARTLARALDLVADFSVAVDGGANNGDWTTILGERFGVVHAFEPALDTFARLSETMTGGPFGHVRLHAEALFDRTGRGALRNEDRKRRARYVERDDDGPILLATVDGLALEACGLLKLDVEGAELLALRGAAETLRRCRPVVIVETDGELCRRYGHRPVDLRAFLEAMDYRLDFKAPPDEVHVPCA